MELDRRHRFKQFKMKDKQPEKESNPKFKPLDLDLDFGKWTPKQIVYAKNERLESWRQEDYF